MLVFIKVNSSDLRFKKIKLFCAARKLLLLTLLFIFVLIVVARNQLGQATATVRVVLGDISTSPESPVVEAMTDTDILISWKTPAALNHTPVICYKVQMGYIGKYISI